MDPALIYYWYRKRKARRNMWVGPIYMVRDTESEYVTLYPMLREDPEKFFNYMRMSISTFDELFGIVEEDLTRMYIHYRNPTSAKERLIITLRHLITGGSFNTVGYSFRTSHNCVGGIVEETCEVIWRRVQPIAMPIPTHETWSSNEEQFRLQYDFPNCIGAVDGKHIRLFKPWNAGSLFYNYKDFHSVVVQAVSDADLLFTVIDVGEYGRNSDGAVFKNSQFGQAFANESLDVPERKQLPGSVKILPHVFVGDEAYPLREKLMRPYSRNLDNPKRVFNHRLSRARKCVERAFGIVTRKFEIFHRPMRCRVSKAVLITKAAFLLHNFIRLRDGAFGDPSEYDTPDGIEDLEPIRSTGRATAVATETRDALKQYFLSDAGNIPWLTQYASV